MCLLVHEKTYAYHLFCRNKSQLAPDKNGWAQLVYRSLHEPNSSLASKLYAMKTLACLSSEVNNKVMIVNYNSGTVIKDLLKLIRDTAGVDMTLNIAAADLMSSLICRSTASKLVHFQPDFLLTLASLGCSSKNKVATPCARIVKRASTFIHSDDDCHDSLLQALVTLSYGVHTEVLKHTVKAYAGEFVFNDHSVEESSLLTTE